MLTSKKCTKILGSESITMKFAICWAVIPCNVVDI